MMISRRDISESMVGRAWQEPGTAALSASLCFESDEVR